MIKKVLFFLIGFISFSEIMYAQDIKHCGHEQYMQQLSIQRPAAYKQIIELEKQLADRAASTKKTAELPDIVINIPVVVHIIHNNASGAIGGNNNTNISDAQIQSQIVVLNNDYQRLNADAIQTPIAYQPIAANCKITFCMANTDPQGNVTNGITRTYSNKANFSILEEGALKSLAYWPSDKYLNIWVCDLRGIPASQILLGYAQKPGAAIPGLGSDDGAAETDGVAINYKAFGTIGTLYSKFNLGRTTTHEVGHWLGLSHTWGDTDSGDCDNTDFCDDTPTCVDPYEASTPLCLSEPPTSCTEARMIQDYMDYSDDACMNLFTKDQKTRMRTAIELSPRRAELFNSLGCCVIPNLKNLLFVTNFEDGTLTSEDWTPVNPNSNSNFTKGFEINGNSSYGKGNFSTSVVNDSMYVKSDPSTHKYAYSFVSPYVNIQNELIPIVRFDWAYSPKAVNGNTDSMVVYVSTGCDQHWVPIKSFYGSSFSSTNIPRSNFVPQANEWVTTELNLSAYVQKTAIQIQFVVYSKGVNTFYLDNINFGITANTLTVSLFPNPTSGILNVQTVFPGSRNVSYYVYNVLGQLVYEAHDDNTYCYNKQIDLSFLANAVYFVSVSDGNEKIVKRIIKQ